MTKFICFLSAFLTVFIGSAQDISGTWNGTLKIQGTQLPLVLHVEEVSNGISATLDSPAQESFGMETTTSNFKDGILTFSVANAGLEYKGIYIEEKDMFEGTFTQNGYSLPLNLKRGEYESTGLVRPQEPKSPFPYHSEDVVFKNKKAGIKLAGTLTIPSETGNFPAVILISGSGPQNRNSKVYGHKPFLVLADYLTKNGIAVLRFDDRGVGDSEGEFSAATTFDFATDVAAAVEFLKKQKGIDPNNIGLVGHSEGGLIAPMVAAKNESVDFIVLLAAPGLQGHELLLLQKATMEIKMGVSEFLVKKSQGIFGGAYDIILESDESRSALKPQLFNYFKDSLSLQMNDDQINRLANQLSSPWMVSLLKSDPSKFLEEVDVPVLAINGAKDVQVPSDENLEAIKAALEEGGNSQITIKEFENLNHLFQESETGLLNEYAQIEQTFSPEALAYIKNWIVKQVQDQEGN